MLTRHPRSSLARWIALFSAIASLAVLGATAQSAGAAITTCSGSGAPFSSAPAPQAGTSANPYLVSTKAELEGIRNSSYRTCAFKQTSDINLRGGSWTSIGTGADMFKGEYDGDNYRISGLLITTAVNGYEGLFGYTGNGAVIKNIRLSGTVNLPGDFGVGALVGLADRPTTITNVHSSVNVTGGSRVGGLVGWLAEGTITRSSSTGQVTGSGFNIGGLVGRARSSFGNIKAEITDSYATGAVGGGAATGVGGLIGDVEVSSVAPYEVLVSDSYAAGSVSGATTGGLIGQVSGANLTVTDSFWDAQTTGQNSSAGGTAKTTAEMKSFSTFSGASWNITDGWSATTVWGICNGSSYPFLSSQYSSSPCPPPPTFNRLSVTKSTSDNAQGTVTSSPSGINCGTTCQASFQSDTLVRLTATPDPESKFTGWSGACSNQTGPCFVQMGRARSVTASFAPRRSFQLTVSKQGTGQGTVSSNPSGINCGSACQASYEEGTQVTLSASAAQGSTFTGWSGACSGTASCQVTMDQARQVTATFTAPAPPFSEVSIKLATPTPARVPPSRVVRAVRVSCEGDSSCRIDGASARAKARKGKSRKAQTSFPLGQFPAGSSRVVEVEIPGSVYRKLKKGKRSGTLTVEVTAQGTEGIREKTLEVGLER